MDRVIEEVWEETWNILKVSDAYREGLTLKEAKPMLSVLFKAAMLQFYKKIKENGFVLVTEDVATTLIWNHVWKVKCKACGREFDLDAVDFLYVLDKGCLECGSKNIEWEVVLG